MYILIDKFALFVCCTCCMLFLNPEPDFFLVTACLSALCCTCFLSCLNPESNSCRKFRQNPLYFLLQSAYLLLCLLLPAACLYLPLILYDALYTGWYLLYPAAVLICLTQLSKSSALLLLLLPALLCILLHFRSRRILSLTRQMKEIRDTSAEYNMMLTARNRDLLEKQDYEIHLATLKERNRIAREIHDNVGHMLSRSLLQSGALLALNQQDNLKEPLLALKNTLNLAMDNIRASVHDLHDDSVDLKAAIEQLLTDYAQYQIHFDYDMSRMVARNIKYCFISITREALSNLVKHSNATQLNIVMREHPSLYQLLIEDNGTDIHPADSGIGLSNMRERVDHLGGTLTIDTETGFRIFISIPKTELS